MDNVTFNGSAQITDEGIKKHFKNFEPINAIFELVWNGLDACAKSININVTYNQLDGLDTVLVIDDGDGVDVKNLENSFEKFNESTKKHDDDKHGSHGKGRLAFHKLCDNAIWFTRGNDFDAKISISSSAIKIFSGVYLGSKDQHPKLKALKTGTCVELRNFGQKNLPEESAFLEKLAKEFGWFIALNKTVRISLNGQLLHIPDHDMHETSFSIDDIDFTAKVIRWYDKPSSEKSFNYLITSRSRVIQKELSKFNNKVTFHTSAYVLSDWLDEYDPKILELDPNSANFAKVYKKIMKALLDFQREIYRDFLRKFVDQQIEGYDAKGYFPNYAKFDNEYAEWRKNNTKKVLKDIYIADPTIFNKLNGKQTKVLIRLLDIVLVSNENDALFDVLDGVLDLDAENMNLLASQLKQTTMENIISTIESLQKRQIAVHKLREIMEHRYKEVLETPDLQKIIENNTWLFGPQYTVLGAEEDSFNTIAKNLRNEIKEVDLITDQDLADGAAIEGVNRQVDLFMARKIPTHDSQGKPIYKCVIVEIKRPGISLNKKHLQQLDDYAEIIAKHPAFTSAKMKFELILIGRKISKDDFIISQRLGNLKDKGEFGLVSDGEIKCYVKDWFTIFDEFELSNNYLLSTLNSKLQDITSDPTEEIVNDLQVQQA